MTAPTAHLPVLPALVEGWVTHRRTGPIRHAFRHGVFQWLVDLDDIPDVPWYLRAFATFRSADHLGDPGRTIKQNVERYLALNGIQLGPAGRVLMLANPRVLGYVFNPLSVFWCYDGTGRLVCMVAEVHNTYGDRHAYLLQPDDAGRATAGKAFHVSPFFDLDGRYELRLALTPERVCTTVTLHRDGHVAFTASFRGRIEPATRRNVARLVVRKPLMPQRIGFLIRMHGLWLWIRGLPVFARPEHIAPPGVAS